MLVGVDCNVQSASELSGGSGEERFFSKIPAEQMHINNP